MGYQLSAISYQSGSSGSEDGPGAGRPRWWGRAASLAFLWAVVGVGLGRVSVPEVRAQVAPRAGLVVQFGDGSVREFCVDLGGEVRTGEELLRLSGVGVVAETTALGTRVCAIGGEGCSADECWCRCRVPGPDCEYWAYYRLVDGRWAYADMGPSSREVRHGDVDGWAWGRGNVGTGAQPPGRSFEELCAPEVELTATNPPPAPTVATATRTPGTWTAAPPAGPPPPNLPSRPPRPPAPSGGTEKDAPVPAATARHDTSRVTNLAGTRLTATVVAENVLADHAATVTAGSATLEALLAAASAQYALAEDADGQSSSIADESVGLPSPNVTASLVPARRIPTPDVEVSPAVERRSGDHSLVGYALFGLVVAGLGGAVVWMRRGGA